MYKKWVARLAEHEFADELVLVAVAMELKILIICVPFTPPDAASQWVITRYQNAASDIPDNRNVYLGNNNMHYMWLSPSIQRSLGSASNVMTHEARRPLHSSSGEPGVATMV